MFFSRQTSSVKNGEEVGVTGGFFLETFRSFILAPTYQRFHISEATNRIRGMIPIISEAPRLATV